MSDIDRAELRRLLDAATPRPWWQEWVEGDEWYAVYGQPTGDLVCPEVCTAGDADDTNLLVAAVNALPDLLDALDALDVAEAAIERVREMHYPADNDPARTPRCEDCQGRAGVHPCGCWAEKDREPVCGHCNAPERGQTVPWPCPTIQAIDGGE